MPPQQGLRLHHEECLLPGPKHPRQKHQEDSLCLLAGRSFDLPTQDDELLPSQRIFDEQFGLPSGQVCDRSEQKGGGARFHPMNNAIMKRVQAMSSSLPERDENREHRLLLDDEKEMYQHMKDMHAL
jgi:hypothetical protein